MGANGRCFLKLTAEATFLDKDYSEDALFSLKFMYKIHFFH